MGETRMDEAIVGDHVRNREHPCVAPLGEHVGAHPGQRPGRRDEPVVHAVHAAGQPPDTVQVQLRHGGTGQHAGRTARGDECPHRLGVHLDVGVQVHAGKGPAGLVAKSQRVRLARHRCLDHAGARLVRERGGAVRAGVGHHHEVELAGAGAGEHPAQVTGDDRLLVVRGHDDADHRYHGGRRGACRRPRLQAHANRLPSPPDDSPCRVRSGPQRKRFSQRHGAHRT